MRALCIAGCVVAAAALAVAVLAGCPGGTFPEPAGEHWLRFAQITDIHILDEESPGRAVRMEKFLAPSWRPQEAYTGQVLDATLQAINRRHYEGKLSGRPVDFVLATGDLCDNAQFNELRWFIDIMDGQHIDPDSGAHEGALRPIDPYDNPNMPFTAFGLAKDIPWYVAYGNHDNQSQGNFSIDRRAADPVDWSAPQVSTAVSLLGLDLMTPPQTALIPTLDQSPVVILADHEQINPNTDQLLLNEVVAGPVPPDPNRHFISRDIFIREEFNTTSMPLGHGFTYESAALSQAWYSVRPKADVPVRLVVLDTAGPDSPEGVVSAGGAMTEFQFESFLKPEMKAAQDKGEFVLVIMHHSPDQWSKVVPETTITGDAFRAYLASQPNVIATISGHMHYHRVTRIAGRYPYYEILTSSLIDFPQEGRMFDLYYDRDRKQFTLRSELFSHKEAPTRLSAESYKRCNVDFLEDPVDYDYVDHVSADPPVWENYAAKAMRPQHVESDADRDFSVTIPRPDF